MGFGTHVRGALSAVIILIACGLLLAACNGSSPDAPSSIPVSQCTGSSCQGQGAPPSTPATVKQLRPAALEYSTAYPGGAGSGEYVKVQFNSASGITGGGIPGASMLLGFSSGAFVQSQSQQKPQQKSHEVRPS